ncbi:hypothetical protein Ndes2437B_g04047 [Nannochloris sp. 'desiccata']
MPPPSKRKKQLAIASAQAQLRRRLARLAAQEDNERNEKTIDEKQDVQLDTRNRSDADTDDIGPTADALEAATSDHVSPNSSRPARVVRNTSRRKKSTALRCTYSLNLRTE